MRYIQYEVPSGNLTQSWKEGKACKTLDMKNSCLYLRVYNTQQTQ